jgi:hypothetical protein
MGFFDSIIDFFKSLFDQIMDVVRSIVEALGPLLPLLVIAAFLFAPALGAWLTEIGMTTAGSVFTAIGSTVGSLGTYALLATGVGVSYLLFPEETSDLIATVTEAVADVAGGIISAGASVVGSGLSALWDSLGSLKYFVLGGGLLWLLSDSSSDVVKIESNSTGGEPNV